jgi:chromosome segregation ATPase
MTAMERNSTLDMQLTNTKAALVQAERKNADLAKEYAVLQTENMSAPATIAGLQKELNEANDTLEQSHIIIRVRDDEHSQAIMTMGKESQALKVQYITVMEMNAALDLQLAKTKEALLQAERKGADSDIAFAVIQAENKSFSATISTLQKELNETKDTLEQSQIIVGWNHTQMEDLSKAMDDYKSKLAELQNENAKLRSNADALRKELQTCKDQVMEEGSLLRKQLADAQKGLDDVGAKMIKSLNSELERLRKELAEARGQLATSNNVESMMAQVNEALAQALNREAVANTNASVAASACAEATAVNALLEAEVTRLKQVRVL